jgi:hypothetical protein
LQVFPLVEESWREARNKLEPFLKEQPDNYALIGDLALTNMGLGDKAAALALSEQAIAVNPIEKDAIVGPIPIEILARVAAQTGEPDRAIAALQKLLSIPYAGALAEAVPLTPALLRLDPMFDPLSDALFPESLKLLWELRVPHVVRPQIDNGYLHPVLYFTCAQIVQQRSPFLEFAQIFTDVFGEQNVATVAAVHHTSRQIQTGTGEIGATCNVNNSAHRPAVDAHTELQARMFLEGAADLHRAANRRFRTCVKNQRHPVAGGNFNQTLRRLGFLKLLGRTDDLRQLIDSCVLLINRKF